MVCRIAKGGMMLALLAGVTLLAHLAFAGAAGGAASSASAVDVSSEARLIGGGGVSTPASCPACFDVAGGCSGQPTGHHCGGTQYCWCKWCGGQFKCMSCTPGQQLNGHICNNLGDPV